MAKDKQKNTGLLIFGAVYFIYAACLTLLLDKIFYAYLAIGAVYFSVFFYHAILEQIPCRTKKGSILFSVGDYVAAVSAICAIFSVVCLIVKSGAFIFVCRAGCACNALSLCLYAFERNAYTRGKNRFWIKTGLLFTIVFPLLSFLGLG